MGVAGTFKKHQDACGGDDDACGGDDDACFVPAGEIHKSVNK